MIQPLRNYHRRVFLVLSLAVPTVFVAGLSARRGNNLRSPSAGVIVVATTNEWQNHLFVMQLSRSSDGHKIAKIFLTKPLDAPDALIYSAEHAPQGSLPPEAHLLGKYDAEASYQVPASGYLILYSAAHNSVLDSAAIGGQP